MNRRTVAAGVWGSVLTASVLAQAPAQMPKPGPEQKQLEVFVGTWTYEGEIKKSVWGPAGKITGTDVYEMLPGGFFLQHRWDEKNPLGSVKGLEIWAYDPIRKRYTYTNFTSLGEMGSGTFTVSGNIWSYSGSGVTYEGKAAQARGTITLTNSTSFMLKAQVSPDGKTWAPLFEGKWTKK